MGFLNKPDSTHLFSPVNHSKRTVRKESYQQDLSNNKFKLKHSEFKTEKAQKWNHFNPEASWIKLFNYTKTRKFFCGKNFIPHLHGDFSASQISICFPEQLIKFCF